MVLVHRLDHELRSLSDLWSLISPAMVVAMGTFALPPDAVTTFPTSKFLGVYGTVPHARAGGMQAEYLHKRGHTRIGYVYPSAPSLGLVATERLAGFKRACRRLQIGAPLLRRVDADRPETITAALDAWLRPDLGVTAIAAHNDEIAIMTCAAISARGLIPGKDLAVIGVDNIPAARIDLTTVEIDVESWGEAVVAAILAILDDEPPPAIRGEFLRLIERKTA